MSKTKYVIARRVDEAIAKLYVCPVLHAIATLRSQ